ncbi:2,3-bisphosphoglycerate-independent phosphoglycerate mutase [uncultured Thiodictyon sp.]|uniref:2,3-bisphosphoglycerate-independent phosphoglycerate mutase n=1 Tax=uncultured Thiodictyon sp. TaxID=1846217 RepID=UPI0025E4A9F0|nr:2,3-bisphosphoglycerate-independent phosphoglycerate mutase [uncultured Thiodictyon sp.]
MSTTHTQAPRRPVILIILDGFGLNPSKANNAIAIADTPRLDHYFAHFPHCALQASGLAVGLPDGQMGNSEVGHMSLGSGGVVKQDLVLIDAAIADGSFFENPALTAAARAAAAAGRPIHLMGLVSDGGVHSHVHQLVALIELCRREGARPMVHVFTDGRDTPPRSAKGFLPPVEAALAAANGRIATVTGRYYAMDRDQRWERTEIAWRGLVDGEGRHAPDARTAIDAAYAAGEDDEFIRPTIIEGAELIQDCDQVIHFNFRKDRPRQMVEAFFQPDFKPFRRHGITGVNVTCIMEYDDTYGLPFAFDHDIPRITLGQVLDAAGIPQFHCAETEKFAHVTFFFNGGRGEPFPLEQRALIPSPKVATYDLQPQMSAQGVADATIAAIAGGAFPFIVVNFANGDMVGHTAIREAVIEAVRTLDREAGRVMDAARENGYSIILTADHGNCDEMIDPASGEPHTQHTVYPVPCLVADETAWRLSTGGGLDAIAPTVLELMGLPIPKQMTGHSLLLGPATV